MRNNMNVGDTVADFSFVATSGLEANLSDYRGKQVVLYFYPKDSTPGCTQESKDFTEQYEHFQAANVVIFGISRDNMKSHDKFKCKYEMPFELISDENSEICNLFDVIKEKSMFGKKYMGIDRSTFLIDEDGKVKHEWRKVKVPGHVSEVLAAASA